MDAAAKGSIWRRKSDGSEFKVTVIPSGTVSKRTVLMENVQTGRSHWGTPESLNRYYERASGEGS